MNVLILHHVESMWASTMWTHCGVVMESYIAQIKKHLMGERYDMVIVTQLEGAEWEAETAPIHPYITHHELYGYGMEMAQAMEYDWAEGNEYAPGGRHSEIVELPDWLHDLVGTSIHVDLIGAFEGECIEDIEVAMCYLDIQYRKIGRLVVGHYEFDHSENRSIVVDY